MPKPKTGNRYGTASLVVVRTVSEAKTEVVCAQKKY